MYKKRIVLILVLILFLSSIFLSIFSYADELEYNEKLSEESFLDQNISIRMKMHDENGSLIINDIYNLDNNETVLSGTREILKLENIPFIFEDNILVSVGNYNMKNEYRQREHWSYLLNGEEMGYSNGAKDILNSGDELEWVYTVINYDLNDTIEPYLSGYSDGTIRPEDRITREESAHILYELLDEDFKDYIQYENNNYIDIKEGNWSNEAILALTELNIVKGYGRDGLEKKKFKPKSYLTKGEAIGLIGRFNSIEPYNKKQFKDIKGHWNEGIINKASSLGWIEGDEKGHFNPEKYVTRAEFITMINRSLDRIEDIEDINYEHCNFKDLEKDKWYYNEIIKATSKYTIK